MFLVLVFLILILKSEDFLKTTRHLSAEMLLCGNCQLAKTYSEPCQTPKMEHFSKIVNSLAVNYFSKKIDLRCLTGFWKCLWLGYYELKVTSATKQWLFKMSHLRHRLRIFYFAEKLCSVLKIFKFLYFSPCHDLPNLWLHDEY